MAKLTIALMDSPYESETTTTVMRIVDAALRGIDKLNLTAGVAGGRAKGRCSAMEQPPDRLALVAGRPRPSRLPCSKGTSMVAGPLAPSTIRSRAVSVRLTRPRLME